MDLQKAITEREAQIKRYEDQGIGLNCSKMVYNDGYLRALKDMSEEITPDEQGYNGWSNYETWAVNLHLSNDEGLYRYACSLRDADELQGVFTNEVYTLIENQSTIWSLVALMYQDLLISSLQSVNWYEVYDALHGEED